MTSCTPRRQGDVCIFTKSTIDAVLEDPNMLNAYSTPEIKKLNTYQRQKEKKTPSNQSQRTPASKHVLSSSMMSPVMSTPSRMFGERGNSGELCCELNAGSIAKPSSWRGKGQAAIIRHLPSSEEALQQEYKYMFQRISSKAAVLNEQLEDMEDMFTGRYGLLELAHVAHQCQVGRMDILFVSH
jgi:hypothetical protein